MYSARDLDLGCNPDKCFKLFMAGSTNISHFRKYFRDITESDQAVEKTRFYLNFVERFSTLFSKFFDATERKILTDAYIRSFDYLPKKILPLLQDADAITLDQVVSCIMGLELDAKKAKDIEKLKKLRRLNNAIIKLLVS